MSTPQQSDAVAHAIVAGQSVQFTHPNGEREALTVENGDVRKHIVDVAHSDARRLAAPVELTTSGDHGEVRMRVHPSGKLEPLPVIAEPTPVVAAVEEKPLPLGYGLAPVNADTELEEEPLPELGEEPLPELGEEPLPELGEEPLPEPASPAVEPEPLRPVAPSGDDLPAPVNTSPAPETPVAASPIPNAVPAGTDAPAPVSFIDNREPGLGGRPTGWRRLAAAIGVKTQPSPAEVRREENRRAVSAQWGQVMRVAVVNGKGGVGKTMTTAMLAAAFARNGGGGVLAWDNNPTRGSLGWRTESSGHDRTVQDVLDATDMLLDPHAARSLIADFVHHQTDDRYDVLRSNPQLLAIRQQIDWKNFDKLIQVIDRNYRLVVFDSGNDESAERWLRMIDWSQQLVIPTIPSAESAESALLLLDELRRDQRGRALARHAGRLADGAVVVLTLNERGTSPERKRIEDGFKAAGVTVVTVPFDPALKSGQLRFEQLQASTQDAWMEVAATVARSFRQRA